MARFNATSSAADVCGPLLREYWALTTRRANVERGGRGQAQDAPNAIDSVWARRGAPNARSRFDVATGRGTDLTASQCVVVASGFRGSAFCFTGRKKTAREISTAVDALFARCILESRKVDSHTMCDKSYTLRPLLPHAQPPAASAARCPNVGSPRPSPPPRRPRTRRARTACRAASRAPRRKRLPQNRRMSQ